MKPVLDLPQRRMCHFVVLYASRVLCSVANYYIRCAEARFTDTGPPPFEPTARYFVDGLTTMLDVPGV